MSQDERLIRIFPNLSEYNVSLEELTLEVSVKNALLRGGILTLAQLLQLCHTELLEMFPNRKLRSYEDVIHGLVCISEEPVRTPPFASMTDISDLLGEIQASGKKFNFFQAAGIWKSEEIHTRLLAELLNPKSIFHDKGADFLGRFLRRIGVNLPPEELENAEVRTEVPANQGRRMDMLISAKSLCLPFEVKIWAGDQDRQLQDYLEYVQSQGMHAPKIYYLTPDRHKPGPRSLGRLSDSQVCLLSFPKDILPWLSECRNAPGVPADVLEIIKQLCDNIQGPSARPGGSCFSRWEEDVLDILYGDLSQAYRLSWTECTSQYMTFTLKKEGSLEFAFRIKKEGPDKIQLYLICGLTEEDGKTNYAIAGSYIADNPTDFQELLKATFPDPNKVRVSTARSVWNRLPEKTFCERRKGEGTMEFAKRCREEIVGRLEELLGHTL